MFRRVDVQFLCGVWRLCARVKCSGSNLLYGDVLGSDYKRGNSVEVMVV